MAPPQLSGARIYPYYFLLPQVQTFINSLSRSRLSLGTSQGVGHFNQQFWWRALTSHVRPANALGSAICTRSNDSSKSPVRHPRHPFPVSRSVACPKSTLKLNGQKANTRLFSEGFIWTDFVSNQSYIVSITHQRCRRYVITRSAISRLLTRYSPSRSRLESPSLPSLAILQDGGNSKQTAFKRWWRAFTSHVRPI